MKSLLRLIWTIAPIATCVAVGGAWVASRHEARVLILRLYGGHLLAMASGNDGVALFEAGANFQGVSLPNGELRSYDAISVSLEEFHEFCGSLGENAPTRFHRAGVQLAMGAKAPAPFPELNHYLLLTSPYWLILLVAAPGVLLAVRRVLICRRRRRKGQCIGCGYDLRVTTAVCPECGAKPAKREPAAG